MKSWKTTFVSLIDKLRDELTPSERKAVFIILLLLILGLAIQLTRKH